jgi:hypothetical protein
MIFEELKKRGLARDSEDKVSIPMHPMVRSLVLTLLAQILRPYGELINADLSPATDRPQLVEALSELLSTQTAPSVGHVIAFDLNTVSVNLGAVPIDEVLSYRKENLEAHRRYCLSVRTFTHELSLMPERERANAFYLRQAELNDIAGDLRKRARKAWKKTRFLRSHNDWRGRSVRRRAPSRRSLDHWCGRDRLSSGAKTRHGRVLLPLQRQ